MPHAFAAAGACAIMSRCGNLAVDMADEMKQIHLDRRAIDRALPQVSRGLQKYMWLQAELRARDVSLDREFQTRFAGFYRVRRNANWRRAFFEALERGKKGRPTLKGILRTLHTQTGRIEASFASKLVATIDPSQPVIDSVVLGNIGLKLPSRGDLVQRLKGIVDLHGRLERSFSGYLKTDNGRYLVRQFRRSYPVVQLTEIKMLDLVLWQTR